MELLRLKGIIQNKRLSKETKQKMLSKHYCYYYSTRVSGAVREMGGVVWGGESPYLFLEPRELALGRSEEHRYLLESHIYKKGKRKTY